MAQFGQSSQSDTSALTIYLREIGKVSLLTIEEEIRTGCQDKGWRRTSPKQDGTCQSPFGG